VPLSQTKLTKIPAGDWFCDSCASKPKGGKSKSKGKGKATAAKPQQVTAVEEEEEEICILLCDRYITVM